MLTYARCLLMKYVRDERGVTAIEYGLIAALISVAAVGVMGTLGGQLGTTFTSITNALKG